MKRETAARVAAMLKRRYDVVVDLVSGRFGELSVLVDDQQVFAANPFWYPRAATVLERVRRAVGNGRDDQTGCDSE